MYDTLWTVVSLAIIVIAAGVAWAGVTVASKRAKASGGFRPQSWRQVRRAAQNPATSPGSSVKPGRVWVVVNPSKMPDVNAFKQEVDTRVLEKTGLPAVWVETTIEDPGTGQAVTALRSKPSVVIAAGGDGTLRAVAAAMAQSGVPMGVLPVGTGNLLARNLGLPLGADEALEVALTPVGRTMDLAWLRMERVAERSDTPTEGALLRQAGAQDLQYTSKGAVAPQEDEYAYLVIAGVGFDGEAMAATKPELKQRMGWSAYFVTALKSLWIERMRATVTIYHGAEEDPFNKPYRSKGRIPQQVEEAVRSSTTLGAPGGVSDVVGRGSTYDMTAVEARTILFANCGELPFALLAPDATLDDGELDLIAIDTRGGLFGWAFLSFKVFGHTVGLRAINAKNDPAKIQFRQTPMARVDISRPYPVQIDGDFVGSARTVMARVDHGALWVRVPVGSSPSAVPESAR